MPKKKQSLSRKINIRLGILGIVLFVSTGLAAGINLYLQDIKIYRRAAESYVNMICYELEMENLSEILSHEEELNKIQEKIKGYVEGPSEYDSYEEIEEEAGDEMMRIFDRWGAIDNFIVGFGNLCADIRYAYVVIPTEKELIYVWDSDLLDNKFNIPFEHLPYSGKEKDHIMNVMRGDVVEDFFMDHIDGELLGTSLSPIYDTDGQICAVAAVDISISSIRFACLKLLLNMGVVILLIMCVSITIYHFVVSGQIISPIVTLTKTADSLVNNLRKESGEPLQIDVHTHDEIDVLARSFEQMDEKLLEYIKENAAITAEKERIGTELTLANRIQADMLPRIFPPFPGRKEIDLYATMSPAREVGGDFYDFFLIDENRLGLVMADVSGKGIPAALFMMMSKIMIQNFAMILDGPGEVLERVNDQISMNTFEEMFVTVWLGVLDLKTGVLTAANAGHEYPILMSPEGNFKLFRDKHGLVIGGMAGYHYREYQIRLEPGSRLFLYTDGLPEASDAENRMFGIERSLKALNEVKDRPPRAVLEHVAESVSAFVGSAPPFDDTTMLCLDYYGAEPDPVDIT